MMATAPPNGSLLRIRDLRAMFAVDGRLVRAVDGVDLDVAHGETVCLVGESGSGKTATALSILGLSSGHPGIVDGSIRFDRRELLAGLSDCCSSARTDGWLTINKDVRKWDRIATTNLRGVRGKKIGMVFQDPVASLSPYMTIGHHLAESLRMRDPAPPHAECRHRAVQLLEQVRIQDPERVLDAYAFELSGGMCQRAMLAIALASDPLLLIADEPTTALDVTTQLEILQLLKELRREKGISLLLITHDLALAATMADTIAVMYAGHVVEHGPAGSFLRSQGAHPYTRGLFEAGQAGRNGIKKFSFIGGSPPDSSAVHAGCRFAQRCSRKSALPDGGAHCESQPPPKATIGDGLRCSLLGHSRK
ncbi:MAG: ABC transporter ATP-binding protein [Ignavibacteriae bacterium]|nr:ABC transporter ATP-binding protein [Ignavibacteriota bacterium]